MSIVFDLILVAALFGSAISLVVSLIRMLWRSRRSSAKRWLAGSAAVFVATAIAAGILGSRVQDENARAKGFNDFAEMSAAEKAGVADPGEWRTKRAQIEQEEAARKATEERRAADLRADAERERVYQERRAADQRAEAERQKAAAAASEAASCMKDLTCIGNKKSVVASVYCKDLVERLAKYQSEWTDGWLETKFSHFRWKDRERGIVTFIGDKVKFQNGFGAWQFMVYECDLDIRTDRPVDVRARPGRL